MMCEDANDLRKKDLGKTGLKVKGREAGGNRGEIIKWGLWNRDSGRGLKVVKRQGKQTRCKLRGLSIKGLVLGTQ
jgi:hypothetical protein